MKFHIIIIFAFTLYIIDLYPTEAILNFFHSLDGNTSQIIGVELPKIRDKTCNFVLNCLLAIVRAFYMRKDICITLKCEP